MIDPTVRVAKAVGLIRRATFMLILKDNDNSFGFSRSVRDVSLQKSATWFC